MPSAVSAATVYAPVSRPVPRMSRTPCDSNRLVTPVRSFSSMPAMRSRSAATSRRPDASSPIVFASASSVSSLPVATMALLGMQSQRCAAPPTMSRSIMVTSAPIDAATVAAVFPAGPPPMITSRTAMRSRLRGARRLP